MVVASALLFAGFLTACARSEPVVTVEYVHPIIPGQLRDCPTPIITLPESVDDRAVAGVILDLFDGWTECRAKLHALVRSIEQ